ncbi:RxLR effector protein [Phytophthora megakarya]|uniref:RxLR effector protein n=1 Tax=Phytophthora megakarya TaxID=4795 RepID=A0A225WEA1_9STRA|nr:RxLR effector protein [Phytophthora megakarya]
MFILVTAGFIAAVSVDSTRHTTVADSYTTIRHSRILRTDVKSTDAEERGIWSNIKSWFKSTYWAYSGTTKAQVEEKLGFKGLSEAKRKASPKYKTYEQYLYKIEGFKLDDWNVYPVVTLE